MISPLRSIGFLTLLLGISLSVAAQTRQTLEVEGLQQPVEILKDQWGISHIYAETEHDLFFAQGYSAARDRLFQFEIWQARATGTMAKFSDPRRERDHGARLFKFGVRWGKSCSITIPMVSISLVLLCTV